jgi:hypothetical protein
MIKKHMDSKNSRQENIWLIQSRVKLCHSYLRRKNDLYDTCYELKSQGAFIDCSAKWEIEEETAK